MKKVERRAAICLLLALFLVAGTVLFTLRLGMEGGKWATYYANDHVFRQGSLSVGSVYDRNGLLLLKYDSGYSEQEIAEMCAMTKANVKKTIHRAKKKLEAILDGKGA